MGFDPARHHRRSIRLRGYDYARAGIYFITIVTQHRRCLFGEIADGEMRPSESGRMIEEVWAEIPQHYAGVGTDAFVLMPNHIHGVIVLDPGQARGPAPTGTRTDIRVAISVGAVPRDRPVHDPAWERTATLDQDPGQARGPAPTDGTLSLADVVQRFKSLTTRRYADAVRQSGWPPFPGRLWQRNYFEHVIRDEESLNRIRAYIAMNPSCWSEDAENPELAGRKE